MRNAKDFLPRQTASQLAQRLALHQNLLAATRRALPSFLREHCRGCWLNRRGQLIVEVDGQEYAAQIRFFLVAIQEAVTKASAAQVAQVQLRTAAPAARSSSSQAVATATSTELIAQEAAASHIPEISGALSRLAASMAGRRRKKSEGDAE
ncbi:DciA family protein [Methylogaea oryzae]|uniref:DUF721 domain-containing protein n=1 Tax=Methylogaea oryzae TaxID=1295382 RepID=A0A8D4VPU8_9GAMM|nr:DciA family protein [Methylogaea oryzae]BBL72233.1 hypothetical protein MoryE10_28390 [Methylogaea oryzae]